MELTKKSKIQNPSSKEASVEMLSISHFRNGKPRQALQVLNSNISAFPDNPCLFYQKGVAKQMLKEYESAIPDFEQYLEAHMNHSNALYRMGFCYHHLRNFDKSISCFKGAYNNFDKTAPLIQHFQKRIDEEHPACNHYYYIPMEQILCGLARSHMGVDKWNEVLRDCDDAIAQNPDYPDSYLLKGIFYHKHKLPDKAKRSLQKAANLGLAKADHLKKQFYGSLQG